MFCVKKQLDGEIPVDFHFLKTSNQIQIIITDCNKMDNILIGSLINMKNIQINSENNAIENPNDADNTKINNNLISSHLAQKLLNTYKNNQIKISCCLVNKHNIKILEDFIIKNIEELNER